MICYTFTALSNVFIQFCKFLKICKIFEVFPVINALKWKIFLVRFVSHDSKKLIAKKIKQKKNKYIYIYV